MRPEGSYSGSIKQMRGCLPAWLTVTDGRQDVSDIGAEWEDTLGYTHTHTHTHTHCTHTHAHIHTHTHPHTHTLACIDCSQMARTSYLLSDNEIYQEQDVACWWSRQRGSASRRLISTLSPSHAPLPVGSALLSEARRQLNTMCDVFRTHWFGSHPSPIFIRRSSELHHVIPGQVLSRYMIPLFPLR